MANKSFTAADGVSAPILSAGVVASLHIHPPEPGQPLQSVEQFTLVAEKGIAEDKRFFGRTRRDAKPSRRQVTLIEREQIAEHAAVLGLERIPPGVVRANIETSGINLRELIGKNVEIGEALLQVHSARTPCAKMDAIAPGLCDLMRNGRQGVVAMVARSGIVRVGDQIRVT